MEKRLISVIVPVYKVETYLDKCVNSIVNQTYKNLEIILVDDGSPDNCGKMCDEWAKKDNRIKVIHKINGGLSEARNFGIDKANGEYICFVDSDDYIHEKYVEILLKNLLDTKSDMSVCSFCEFFDGKPYSANIDNVPKVYEGEENIMNFLLVERTCNSIVAWTKLYKREIFDNGLRFDVGRLHEDEFIAHKVYSSCKKIVVSFAELYYYYRREGSITKDSKFKEKNLDAFYSVESRYNYFANGKWNQEALNLVIGTSAYVYFVARQRHAEKKLLKILRQKFMQYYKMNKHKKLSHYIFRFSPLVYCVLMNIKTKK